MKTYLKQNSSIPEFYISFDVITETPSGHIEITETERQTLQSAIDSNPSGSVVNGLWTAP